MENQSPFETEQDDSPTAVSGELQRFLDKIDKFHEKLSNLQNNSTGATEYHSIISGQIILLLKEANDQQIHSAAQMLLAVRQIVNDYTKHNQSAKAVNIVLDVYELVWQGINRLEANADEFPEEILESFHSRCVDEQINMELNGISPSNDTEFFRITPRPHASPVKENDATEFPEASSPESNEATESEMIADEPSAIEAAETESLGEEESKPIPFHPVEASSLPEQPGAVEETAEPAQETNESADAPVVQEASAVEGVESLSQDETSLDEEPTEASIEQPAPALEREEWLEDASPAQEEHGTNHLSRAEEDQTPHAGDNGNGAPAMNPIEQPEIQNSSHPVSEEESRLEQETPASAPEASETLEPPSAQPKPAAPVRSSQNGDYGDLSALLKSTEDSISHGDGEKAGQLALKAAALISRKNIAKLNDDQAALKADLAENVQSIQDSQNTVQNLQSKEQELARFIERTGADLNESAKKIESTRETIQESDRQIASLEQQLRELEERLKQETSQNKRLQLELKSASDQKSKLEQRLETLKSDKSRTLGSISDTESKIQDLEREKERVNQRIDKVLAALQRQENSRSKVEEALTAIAALDEMDS